jgi:hypothetical protein
MLNFSPGVERTQASVPASRYSQAPPTHSMVSGAPVPKVSVAGNTTPTDLRVPSG